MPEQVNTSILRDRFQFVSSILTGLKCLRLGLYRFFLICLFQDRPKLSQKNFPAVDDQNFYMQ